MLNRPMHLLVTFSILLGLAACAPSARQLPSRSGSTAQASASKTVSLKVDGLDAQAQAKITQSVGKLGKVQQVTTNSTTGIVRITFTPRQKVSNQQLIQAVQQAGYTPKQVLQSPLELSQLEKTAPSTR